MLKLQRRMDRCLHVNNDTIWCSGAHIRDDSSTLISTLIYTCLFSLNINMKVGEADTAESKYSKDIDSAPLNAALLV